VTRRIRNGFLVCLALAFLAFSAIALAGTPSSRTKVVLDSLTQTGEGPTLEGHFVGHLKSPNDKCLRHRTVKLFLRNGNNDKEKLADTDTTGRRGRWTLDGNLFTIDRARIKVTRAAVGSGENRRICEADSITRFFA
jgi:hypothetical protein